jgi:zinc transporter ZupT
MSDILLSDVDANITAIAAAFAGGSLLYVATTDLLPMIHAKSNKKFTTLPAFIVGVLLMSVIVDHHHHEDEHTL